MGSQLDLDQGGTYRETQKVYLGPSVGWVEIPSQWWVPVTVGGTTNILLGTNLVTVNFNGAVTIQLPPVKATAAGAQAIPRQFAMYPTVIADVGGFAFNNNIIVLPGDGTLSGLASSKITSNYGALVLRPDIINGGWTFLQ